MKKQILHTPEGVRDIYGSECREKLEVQNRLHQVLRLYGYADMQTPSFEFFDVFGKEVGTVSSRELYKFFDRDGNTLVLRPDMTPSVARAAARYFAGEKEPVRICYTGNTFINHLSYQGRLKEATQLGAELMGDASVEADAEILAMVVEGLLTIGLKEFQVSVGQVEYFKSLVREAGLAEEQEQTLRELISNKNYFGVEELVEEQEIPAHLKEAFFKLPRMFGTAEILKEAKAVTENPEAIAAIERLEQLYQVLRQYGAADYITFDLGTLNKYHYYTGITFGAYTYGTGEAVVTGGRYDNLLAHFGSPMPSVGFGIVLDQLLNALRRQKIQVPGTQPACRVFYEEGCLSAAIKEAKRLRRSGIGTALLKLQPGQSVSGEELQRGVYLQKGQDEGVSV